MTRCFRLALSWLCVALVAIAGTAQPGPAPRRNILLLIGDDHGLEAGCYGNPVIRTPHLDRLAREGVRFANAFSTVASCSPSRSVIYTGLFIHTNGQYGLAHPPHKQSTGRQIPSLPALLNARGYRTAVIGKLHVEPPEVYPFGQVLPSAGGNRDVATMAQRARQFFAASDQPFCLVVGFSDPHRAGAGFANDRTFPEVETIRYRPEEVIVPPFLPDSPEVRRDLAEYYTAVSRLDQGIGSMIRALEETGKLDETLVIYTSDNGMPFPGAKTNLYDAGIHLPLIVRAPEQRERGVVNEAMVSWVDLLPTLLEWAGVPPPTGLPGRSLLPILATRRPAGWDTIFASHVFHEITMYYPMRAIRTRQHKLIWNLAHELPFPHASDLWGSPTWQHIRRRADGRMGSRTVAQYLQRPEFELYDVVADPHELRNLAGDPACASVLADLRTRLRQWMEETRDPWLQPIQRER